MSQSISFQHTHKPRGNRLERRLLLIGLMLALVTILVRAFLSLLLGGWELIMGGLVLAAFSVFLLPRLLECTRIRINIIDALIIAFGVWVIVRALFTENFPLRPAVGIALYLGIVPAYVMARVVGLNWQHMRWAAWAVWLFLVLFAVLEISIGQPFGNLPLYTSRLPFFPHRLSSTLGSSNHFSIAMTVTMIFITAECALNVANSSRRLRALLIGLAVNGIGILLMFGAGQRAAVFVYLFILPLLALIVLKMTPGRRQWKLIVIGGVVLIVSGWIVLRLTSDSDSFVSQLIEVQMSAFDESESSNFQRNDRYRIIMNFMGENVSAVLTGIGVAWTDNFPDRVGLQTFFARVNEVNYVTTESSLLKLWLELGIVGVALWYGTLLLVIALSLKLALGERYNLARATYLGMSLALLSVVARSAALQVFDIPLVQLFTFTTLAIVAGRCKPIAVFKLERSASLSNNRQHSGNASNLSSPA